MSKNKDLKKKIAKYKKAIEKQNKNTPFKHAFEKAGITIDMFK